AFLAHFLVKGDRLSTLKVVGLLLGLGGTALLVGAPDAGEGPNALLATELLVLMPVTWAIAAVLQSRFLTRSAPIPFVAVGTWARPSRSTRSPAGARRPRRPRRRSPRRNEASVHTTLS